MRLDVEKLYGARLLACEARPYLATALFALNVVESDTVPTMGVDRWWRCYVSPAFVERTTPRDLAGVWVHEVSHLVRNHHGRGDRIAAARGFEGRAGRLRLNLAADCEINDDIYDEDLPSPEGVVRPQDLRLDPGLLMEDYAVTIGLGPLTERFAWHDCGSGADGMVRPWDLGPDGAHGLSASERAAIRFRVAQGLLGAPGTGRGGWRRWANDVVHPPQPWRDLLGGAVRAAVTTGGAGDDYTYGRLARRGPSVPGVVLPSLRRRPPRVGVVVDTSGSVSDDELGAALLEVSAILRSLGGRRDLVTVVSCDVAMRVVGPVCADTGSMTLLGGGGTDLRKGIAALGNRGPAPDAIVVFTDGQTP